MTQLLPRFTDHYEKPDPVELLAAARQAREEQARQQIADGIITPADPQDLRGIPCIARGVGGTQPGTDPLRTTVRRLSIRRTPYPDVSA